MCWHNIRYLCLALSLALAGCGGDGTDLGGGNTGGGTTPTTEPTTEPTPDPGAPSDNVVLTIPGDILELDRRNATIPFTYTLDLPPSFTAVYGMDISGTAVPGEDYDLDNSKLTFPPGQQSAVLNLTTKQSNQPRGGRTVKIRFFNDEGQEATQTFIIMGDVRLNDTGMEQFSDENSYDLATTVASHPGQDAERGADVVNTTDSNAAYFKNGSEMNPVSNFYLGQAGFRYTKIDFAGNELSAQAADWRCIRDEMTGMVWERKSSYNQVTAIPDPAVLVPPVPDTRETFYVSARPADFHAVNFVYPWLDEDDTTNGGEAGWMADLRGAALPQESPYQPALGVGAFTQDVNAICAFSNLGRDFELFCSTGHYVKEANHQGVCGYKDWQVPTVEQFRSVFNYSNLNKNETDILDKTFFDCAADNCVVSNDPSNPLNKTLYWTSTTSAENNASALCFDITTARLQLCSKLESNKVMIVRRDDKSLTNNNTPSPEPTAEPTP